MPLVIYVMSNALDNLRLTKINIYMLKTKYLLGLDKTISWEIMFTNSSFPISVC